MTRILLAALAILLAATLGLAWWAHHESTALASSESQVTALQSDLRQQAHIGEVTTNALTARLASKVALSNSIKDIQRAIPQEVPASTPDLPPGWRMLHDAAAGVQLPDSASSAPAAPVAAASAADTIVQNYGSCRDQDDAYQGLQQWLKQVSR